MSHCQVDLAIAPNHTPADSLFQVKFITNSMQTRGLAGCTILRAGVYSHCLQEGCTGRNRP